MLLRTEKVHHREFEVRKNYSRVAALQKISHTYSNVILFKGTVIIERCFSEIIVSKKKLFCIFTAVSFLVKIFKKYLWFFLLYCTPTACTFNKSWTPSLIFLKHFEQVGKYLILCGTNLYGCN